MKTFIPFLILILFSIHSKSYSQVNGKAIYETILAKNGYAPLIQELLVQEGMSTFKTINKTSPDKVMVDEETGVVTLNPTVPDSIQAFIVSDFKKKEIISKVFLTDNGGETYNELHVREPLNIIWDFKNENKTISGYPCKKALTNYRGRKYIAWYTEKIPLSVGPWKFHGLPGLIIKISDLEEEVSFLLKKIDFPHKEDLKIDPSIYKDIIGIDEYFQLKNIAREKSGQSFESKMLAKLPRGATIELTKDENNDIEKTIN